MTLTAHRAAALAAVTLAAVYVATLAPSVTFWDAGEFIAAAHSLGIPHPPGTPLFVVALNAWARLFPFLPYAVATNLFSAVCTAAAGALTAWFVARATRQPMAGLAAALAAGGMSTVWSNATETEVYAASLAVAVCAIVAADRAGRTGDRRWLALAAYCLALAVPVHLSILVAAPVVILLAADRGERGVDWEAGLLLTGAAVCIAGVGRMSPEMVVAGLILTGVALPIARRLDPAARGSPHRAMAVMATIAVACSALAFLVIRARFDPAVNQGNPSTLGRMAYVVARRQYDVPGLWPRRAPVWLQLANWFEYADWQVALSLAPGVVPNVWRIIATCLFAALGLFGAASHRARDPRTWRAVLLLFVCGSLGVVVYLNLRAGRSFGWPFVPDENAHEARDRDYFFTLAFWAWGIWAGVGAVAIGRRLRRAWLGVVIAALPIALNWSVVNRRQAPSAGMPREVARQLLEPLPSRTVLFVEGDNDTYPLWYAQQVEGMRRDVTVVTIPLLGARWYLDELRRRAGLVEDDDPGDAIRTARRIAAVAVARGRPVAASNALEPAERRVLAGRWRIVGLAAVADPSSVAPERVDSAIVSADTAALRRAAQGARALLRDGRVKEEPDPIHEYFAELLGCPGRVLTRGAGRGAGSLDSLCNLR